MEHALAAMLGTSSRASSGDTLLSLSVRTPTAPETFLLGTYVFGEGQPLALVSERGSCFAQMGGRGAPLVYKIFPPTGDLTYRLGWLDLNEARVAWLESTVTETLETFDFGTSWGRMVSRQTVFVANDPMATDLTSIYEGKGTLFDPSGQSGLAAWTDWADPKGRVLAWRQGEPPAVVAEGPWNASRFGFSEERFAWIGATGVRVSDGMYESARLYSCKVPSPVGPCDVEAGPSLPLYTSSGVLVVSGPYIAFTGCSEVDCDVYVVDWGTSALYVVHRPHPDHGVEVIGVSDTQLLVADSSPDVRGTGDFDTLVLFDLAELDSFATRL